jgi:hypothetical protein
LRRAVCAVAVLVCALSVEHARADDPYANAKRDVIAAQDFRVRVAAALALGKSKDTSGARPALEKALGDGHPAVRSAAAAGLGALGDKDAIPALERQLSSDASDSVKSQIRTSLERLKGGGAAAAGAQPVSLAGVQIVVQLGTMRNSTSVRGEQLAQVLRSATKSKAQSIPHVAVAEVGDAALLKQAVDKKVPVVALDGAVLKLAQGQSGQTVTFQAQVEYSLRRVSDQSLKGLLTGSASAYDSSRGLSQTRVAELQDQAVQAAVESALRGADKSMQLAIR